jgi:hypothetical protein
MAMAISNPPYEVYPCVAEVTDNPPVNYMKVCEPGRSGEANASYIVLGISFPRTYQAVTADYDGDLVIPAYIDGLPVRKINEAAFVACSKLRSVRVPSTVREVGSRAFAECWLLTNIIFETGVSTIGNAAFSNCVSLSSISFPATLSRLGVKCFQGCVGLKDVYFEGDAPRFMNNAGLNADDESLLGESIFRNYGYYERFKVHILENTQGWIAPYKKGVPEKWPIDFGYLQAHETVAEKTKDMSNSEVGFVAVVTEIKGSSVAIPELWAARYPTYSAKFGNDFAASLVKQTGKKDSQETLLQVWHDYVAGTDPTDVNDVFKADIKMENGEPVISWTPRLSAEESAKRVYTILGRQSLFSEDWDSVEDGDAKRFNFFKVTVEMK